MQTKERRLKHYRKTTQREGCIIGWAGLLHYWTYFVASMEANFGFHGSSWKLRGSRWKLVEAYGSSSGSLC